jgi:transcriptional regulator NrdR family protein
MEVASTGSLAFRQERQRPAKLDRGRETMIEVIKRDGTRQPFSEQKLRGSIENAAKEAEIPASRIEQVVSDAAREPLEMAKGTKPVETKTIRDRVLGRLDKIEPSVSEAWRGFDQTKKKA